MEDGYPEDGELEKIKNWNMSDSAGYHLLMGYIETLWHWNGLFKYEDNVYTLVTGGWSGNESIIGAMMQNVIFWLMYWESSERGGRHKFCDIRTSLNNEVVK
jgi:hypothetical protein